MSGVWGIHPDPETGPTNPPETLTQDLREPYKDALPTYEPMLKETGGRNSPKWFHIRTRTN
jgi:hypothetical protein